MAGNGKLAMGVLGLAVACAAVVAQPAPVREKPTGVAPTQPEGRPVQPTAPPAGQRPAAVDSARALEQAMKIMNRSLKNLEANIDKADQKEANLADISQMQSACVGAKRMKPSNIKDPSEKGQEAYRRSHITLLKMLIELEEQVLDGKAAEAKATLGKIKSHKDAAHKEFEKDEPQAPAVR